MMMEDKGDMSLPGIAICGILPPRFENRFSGATSCPLPSGHDGPHRSTTKWDGEIEWQTAWDCQCEECQKDEPADWCFDWSPVRKDAPYPNQDTPHE